MPIMKRTDKRMTRINLERRLVHEEQQLSYTPYIENTQRMLNEKARHEANIAEIKRQLEENEKRP